MRSSDRDNLVRLQDAVAAPSGGVHTDKYASCGPSLDRRDYSRLSENVAAAVKRDFLLERSNGCPLPRELAPSHRVLCEAAADGESCIPAVRHVFDGHNQSAQARRKTINKTRLCLGSANNDESTWRKASRRRDSGGIQGGKECRDESFRCS